jgi:hypothetical protein
MFYGAGLFISIFFDTLFSTEFFLLALLFFFFFFTFLDGIGNESVKMTINVCKLKCLLDSFEQNRHQQTQILAHKHKLRCTEILVVTHASS